MEVLILIILFAVYYLWLLPKIIIWIAGVFGIMFTWLQAFAIIIALWLIGTLIRE